MYFHAPRNIVENPALLVEALQNEIPLKLGGASQCSCTVNGLDIRIVLHRKRFRANVSVDIRDCRSDQRLFTKETLAELRSDTAMAIERERKLRETLRVRREHREKLNALRERVLARLAELNVAPIDAAGAVEAEIDFVAANHSENADALRLAASILDEQQSVVDSLNEQRFEAAADHCDKRDRLLDLLYDRCSA